MKQHMRGGLYDKDNEDYYLYTGVQYWTMSIFYFDVTSSRAVNWRICKAGSLSCIDSWENFEVRPVINLNPNVEVISGNGTSSSPYVIKTN